MALARMPSGIVDAEGLVAHRAADSVTDATGGKSVYPEMMYFFIAGVAIGVGAIVGTYLFDNASKGISFTPPTGVGIFALFYVVAQVIERLQEPFTPSVDAPKAGEEGTRLNKRKARALLESAIAGGDATEAANAQRNVDQIRANTTVLLFGTSALLAMLACGYLKAGFMQTVGVTGLTVWIEVLLTGLVVGGGTKSLHDLISNLQAAKEDKKDPKETKK